MERRTRGREMTNKEVKNNFVQNLAEKHLHKYVFGLYCHNCGCKMDEVVSNDT